jgi:hypothetical protein
MRGQKQGQELLSLGFFDVILGFRLSVNREALSQVQLPFRYLFLKFQKK